MTGCPLLGTRKRAMKRMQLADTLLPQNVGRPGDRGDFDLPIGSHVYRFARATASGSIWETSVMNNIMGLIFALVLWPVVIYFATADVGFGELALWLKVVLGMFACIGVLATLLMTGMIFYRRRLIVDHDAQELRFCRWTDRAYHVVPLSEIRAMSFENVQHMGGSEIELEDGSTTHMTSTQVLMAELHDGRIASIAFRPAHGLFEAITGWTRAEMSGPEQPPPCDVRSAAPEEQRHPQGRGQV